MVKAVYRKAVTLNSLNADTGPFPPNVPQVSGSEEIGIGVDIPEVWCFSITGNWVGTITFFTSADNINFFPCGFISVVASGPAYVASTSINGLFKASPLIQGHGGVTCKCIMTAYTSGAASVAIVELHGSRED